MPFIRKQKSEERESKEIKTLHNQVLALSSSSSVSSASFNPEPSTVESLPHRPPVEDLSTESIGRAQEESEEARHQAISNPPKDSPRHDSPRERPLPCQLTKEHACPECGEAPYGLMVSHISCGAFIFIGSKFTFDNVSCNGDTVTNCLENVSSM